MKIYVYPDYMSTGLWGGENGTGANLDAEKYIADEKLRMILHYWHWMWKGFNEYRWELEGKKPNKNWLLDGGYKIWYEDGKQIVEWLNEHSTEHTFIYYADSPEQMVSKYYEGE